MGGGNSAAIEKYEQQIQELKLNHDTLSTEREFYFSKLRDIEILIQAQGGENSENPMA